MQLLATGKWSKVEKRWKMIVALRQPAAGPSRSAQPRAGKLFRLHPGKKSDA